MVNVFLNIQFFIWLNTQILKTTVFEHSILTPLHFTCSWITWRAVQATRSTLKTYILVFTDPQKYCVRAFHLMSTLHTQIFQILKNTVSEHSISQRLYTCSWITWRAVQAARLGSSSSGCWTARWPSTLPSPRQSSTAPPEKDYWRLAKNKRPRLIR